MVKVKDEKDKDKDEDEKDGDETTTAPSGERDPILEDQKKKEQEQSGNNLQSGKPNLTKAQREKAQAMKKEAQELGLALVDSGQLAQMLKQMEDLKSIVYATADKSRLQKFNDKNKKSIQHVVRINLYPHEEEMLPVLGWTNLIVDQVYKNENGAYVERQLMELVLQGGKKIQVPYIDFVKKSMRIDATIKKRIVDENENLILNVIDEEGRELNIAAIFVN